jgi:DNA replication protein DnaC
MKNLLKTHLLLFDDFKQASMADSERMDLLEVIEDKYDHASTLMASQLPVEPCHESIVNPTLADAILGCLIHKAHRIDLKGGSIRKNSTLTQIDFYAKYLSTSASLRSDKGAASFN